MTHEQHLETIEKYGIVSEQEQIKALAYAKYCERHSILTASCNIINIIHQLSKDGKTMSDLADLLQKTIDNTMIFSPEELLETAEKQINELRKNKTV